MAPEVLSEDWLLTNLPAGWTYDCTFTPEPAFLIWASEGGAAPRYGPLRIPLRLLKNEQTLTDLSDHGHLWEQRARRAGMALRAIREQAEIIDSLHDPEFDLLSDRYTSDETRAARKIASIVREFYAERDT